MSAKKKQKIHLDILQDEPAIGDLIVFKANYSGKLMFGTILGFTSSGCPEINATSPTTGSKYIMSVKKEFLIYKKVNENT